MCSSILRHTVGSVFFFQAGDGKRAAEESHWFGDVYKKPFLKGVCDNSQVWAADVSRSGGDYEQK